MDFWAVFECFLVNVEEGIGDKVATVGWGRVVVVRDPLKSGGVVGRQLGNRPRRAASLTMNDKVSKKRFAMK